MWPTNPGGLMKRRVMVGGIVLSLVAFSVTALQADVKTRDKSQAKFEGMLGRMIGMFGGKAAREGIVASTAVKGNRKLTMNESTAEIVDLSEEKVYALDLKKKTYQVTTFDELRQRLREAQERARKDAEKAEKEEPSKEQPADAKEPQVEVDFDMKETGEKKSIAGYDAREIVMTVTVRAKGKTLEEGGGLVLTADNWLGPEIPAMKELADFQIRYFKAIAPETAGVSPEQMATLMAMYPMVKQAIDRINKEKVDLRGTPLSTVMTFDAVKTKEQMEQSSEPSSGGGLSGLMARKIMKKKEQTPRSTILTVTNDVLEISTSVAPGEVDIPAGFKEKK
jgi:hypothetical protein